MRRTNRRKLQSNGMFPCAKTSSFQGKQRMLGFEHFESLEALRDFGALQAELGRNAEAREQEIRERERENSFEKKAVGDLETSNLDCLNYLNTAPGCVSVVWFHPKSLLTSREPLISFAPCLTFLTGTPRLAPNTCRSPTLLGCGSLKTQRFFEHKESCCSFERCQIWNLKDASKT